MSDFTTTEIAVEMIDIVLLLFLVATTLTIVRLRSLFAVAAVSGAYSLLSAGLFFVLDAPDVAFTEAAVGAGIATVLLLATLSLTARQQRMGGTDLAIGPFLLVSVIGAILIYGTLDMPHFGDPEAPVHTNVVPRFIEGAKPGGEIGVPNIVTDVLASYRGYDTFGETTVVFTAAIGVMLLLNLAGPFCPGLKDGPIVPPPAAAGESRPPPPPSSPQRDYPILRENTILWASARPLIPFIMVFALYVQFHGDYGPGGGFQAGVIFASALVLYGLLVDQETARKVLPPRPLAILISGGVLLYGSVGVVSTLMGGDFLDYSVLAHDPVHGQHYGILIVELGVGMTVAAVMIELYVIFSRRRSIR